MKLTREFLQDQMEQMQTVLRKCKPMYTLAELEKHEAQIEVFRMALSSLDGGWMLMEFLAEELKEQHTWLLLVDGRALEGYWQKGFSPHWHVYGMGPVNPTHYMPTHPPPKTPGGGV